MKPVSHRCGQMLSVALAVMSSIGCEARRRGGDRVAGDTIVIRTGLRTQIDTARLDIVARYTLQAVAGDTTPPIIETLEFDGERTIHFTTDDRRHYRIGAQGQIES